MDSASLCSRLKMKRGTEVPRSWMAGVVDAGVCAWDY